MVFADNINLSDADIDEKIEKLKKKNFSAKDISIILSELFDVSKNEIYKKAL